LVATVQGPFDSEEGAAEAARTAARKEIAERGLPPDSLEVRMPGAWEEPTTNEISGWVGLSREELAGMRQPAYQNYQGSAAKDVFAKSAAEIWSETSEISNARKAFFGCPNRWPWVAQAAPPYSPATIQDDHEVA
jgi:hypothetical protein